MLREDGRRRSSPMSPQHWLKFASTSAFETTDSSACAPS